MAEPRTIQIERKHSRTLNASIETFSRIHTFPHNPNPNPPLPSKIGVGFQIQKHWGSSPHSTINHTPLTPQNICHTFPHPTHHTALVALCATPPTPTQRATLCNTDLHLFYATLHEAQ